MYSHSSAVVVLMVSAIGKHLEQKEASGQHRVGFHLTAFHLSFAFCLGFSHLLLSFHRNLKVLPRSSVPWELKDTLFGCRLHSQLFLLQKNTGQFLCAELLKF